MKNQVTLFTLNFYQRSDMEILLVTILIMFTATAFACPKGEHLHGGYGSHNAGGYCSY